VSGTMSATLTDGKQYRGQFFEITKDTRVDNLGPLWTGWNPGWRGFGGFDYWDAGPSFVTALLGPGRGQSRCSGRCAHALQFQLAHPSEGMAGGGRGQCQMPDGKTIDATFPTA